jgi:hypothetical protein
MRYVCLWYADPPDAAVGMAAAGAARAQRVWEAEMLKSGRLTEAGAIDASAAATLRVRIGGGAIVEPAGAVSNAAPAGFFVIVARDYNDSLRVASESPAARQGRIAVYPVVDWR